MMESQPRPPTPLDDFLTIYRYGPLWGATRVGYEYSPALLGRLTPSRRILHPVAPARPPASQKNA